MVNEINKYDDIPFVPPAEPMIAIHEQEQGQKKQKEAKKEGDKEEGKFQSFQGGNFLLTPQSGEHGISLSQYFLMGSLILEKRNTELAFFLELNKENAEPTELNRLKKQITGIENEIGNLELQPTNSSENGVKMKEQLTPLDYLEKLKATYWDYAFFTEKESEAIVENDYATLQNLMTEKKAILEKIQETQQKINFRYLIDLPENAEEKVKANEILSDIHTKMDRIVKKEDENNAELNAQKDEIKKELGNLSAESKLINRYSQAGNKPRFIDTTK